MKVIIAGGRDFAAFIDGKPEAKTYEEIKFGHETLAKIFANKTPSEIVCGEAQGADKLGKNYGIARKIPIKSFKAEWDKLGKKAGPIRNEKMAQYATHCICFWDGVSRGTKNMIDLAEQYKLITRVIRY